MPFTKNFLLVILILSLTVPKVLWHFAMDIPAFIAHYEEHKAAQQSISVFEFIAQHTSNNDHHGKDSKQHDHLPFHSHSCEHGHTLNFIPLPPGDFLNIPNKNSASIKMAIRADEHHSGFPPSIWQPPKISEL